MRPLRIEFPGAVYHVISRGIERRSVFRDDGDRKAFLTLLGHTVSRWGWVCHSYCLMGNHYHLLVETPEPNLSRGMRQLNGEYGQAFNRRHGRAGHLFQGRFHAVLVEKETHLLELCRYVVLNPVRARIVKAPGQWEWSSYRATAGEIEVPPFLKTRWILAQFSRHGATARATYVRFVAQGRGLRAPEVLHGLWVGREGFLDKIRGQIEERADIPEFRRAQRRADRAPLAEMLALEETCSREELIRAVGRAYLEGRYTQREIAQYLGVHYMTVCRLVKSFEQKKGVDL